MQLHLSLNPLIIMGMHLVAKYYEAQRKKAGAAGGPFFFNSFWLIERLILHFCVNMMYMRDPMHQIDNGIIVAFLKVILRKYRE